MDFEPWWLIIVPVLFALGWVAARVDIRQMLSETKALPKSYFKGLNFLLNEEPDRAIDAFIEVAKLDPETTELHFALGNLFRRRGEMERAIRVHKSLLARADLPQSDREMAQHELAQDFLKAGMLDRAEAAFTNVLQTRYAVPAIKALIRIYESGHEWHNAIDAVQKLNAMANENVPQLAHYQCELALSALSGSDPDVVAAREYLDLAAASATIEKLNDHNKGTLARIAIMRAELAKKEGNPEKQCEHLMSVLESAPEYASLIADDLLHCYENDGNLQGGLDILKKHYFNYPSLDVFSVIIKGYRKHNNYQEAYNFIHKALSSHPTLLGLDRAIESELNDQNRATVDVPGIPYADLDLMRTIISRHAHRLDKYSCNNCGFEARHYYWQCPGCNGWDTYKPRRIEEFQ